MSEQAVVERKIVTPSFVSRSLAEAKNLLSESHEVGFNEVILDTKSSSSGDSASAKRGLSEEICELRRQTEPIILKKIIEDKEESNFNSADASS
jgi:hypothetical protein